MHDRPKARTEQLISERIDDELVIYDQLRHAAHCLSRDAVCVWEHCDGRLTEAEIAHRLELSLEVVQRAVSALEERGLLDNGPAVSDYSRREAAIRIARIGGAVLAGPLVYSVDVGTAAAKASHLAAGCVVTTCGSCTSASSCSSLCGPGTAGNTSTNSICASGHCYCSLVNSSGKSQQVLACSIGATCHGDATSTCTGGASGPCGCTTNANCCGNNCAKGGNCQQASPSC